MRVYVVTAEGCDWFYDRATALLSYMAAREGSIRAGGPHAVRLSEVESESLEPELIAELIAGMASEIAYPGARRAMLEYVPAGLSGRQRAVGARLASAEPAIPEP